MTRLSVEVVACKHGLASDGSAFLLWVDHRVSNLGNKSTKITGMEAHFVDPQNNLRIQEVTLNAEVDAKASINVKVQFSFSPPFPYVQNFLVHFILYHAHGREVLVSKSAESERPKQP